MDFVRWSRASVCILQLNDGADALRIARGPFQANPNTRSGARVAIKSGRVSILPDCEVEPPVMIVVAQRRASAFPVDCEAAVLGRNRDESTASVAFQPESTSGIAAGGIRRDRKEILADKNVFVAIAVQIPDGDPEQGRQLSFRWQRP